MTSTLGWTMLRVGAAAALLAGTGCGSDGVVGGGDDVAGQAPEMTIDLDDPWGGLDAESEQPGFGDGFYGDALGEDIPVTDVLAGGGAVEETPGAAVLYLRAVWGRQTAPPQTEGDTRPDCGSLQWDGSLSVSDGAIRPVAVIRFERGGDFADSLLLPREDRSVLEWGSTTGCGRDGVLIRIVVPAGGNGNGSTNAAGDGLTGDDTVTFATGPLTVAFPLTDVADLDTTILVDDANGVHFVGFDRDDAAEGCRRGIVDGVWAWTADGGLPGGYFRAAWLDPVGRLFGHVRGRWGTREDGAQVFLGKLIDRNGTYRGHVRGTWERTDLSGFSGTFHGKWYAVSGGRGNAGGGERVEVYRGSTRGFWRGRASDAPPLRGLMQGMWTMQCNPRDRGDDGGGPFRGGRPAE